MGDESKRLVLCGGCGKFSKNLLRSGREVYCKRCYDKVVGCG